jgi:hypothetical protein
MRGTSGQTQILLASRKKRIFKAKFMNTGIEKEDFLV